MTHTRQIFTKEGWLYMYCQQCPWHTSAYNLDKADELWSDHAQQSQRELAELWRIHKTHRSLADIDIENGDITPVFIEHDDIIPGFTENA